MKWIKSHLMVIAGLALPILLIMVFVISNLPFLKADPPRYSLLYSIWDPATTPYPIQVNLIVKNKQLIAQYTKIETIAYYGLKKLYFFDAKTQKVRELSLDFPNFKDNSTYKESIVQSAKQYKIDTSPESPDGYVLYINDANLNAGLLSDLILGGNNRNPYICLKKNSTCIKLNTLNLGSYMNSNSVQFIGWVLP
jgi:hypothetical protein